MFAHSGDKGRAVITISLNQKVTSHFADVTAWMGATGLTFQYRQIIAAMIAAYTDIMRLKMFLDDVQTCVLLHLPLVPMM